MCKILTLIFIICGALLHSAPEKNYEIVICAVFQDEELFIKEWIEYHRLLGVDHFYLYNNRTQDRSLEILKPYVDKGIVDLYDWDVETNSQKEYLQLLQVPAYMHALEIAKKTAKWSAFIDIDEFIAPKNQNSLKEFLKGYSQYGGITINWQIFGTSNLDDLPQNGLVTELMTWKAPVNFPKNEYIKYIVQPGAVKNIHDPHHFEFHNGFFAVNAKKEPTTTIRGQPIEVDILAINHYWFGTKNWFLYNKLPRREKWGMALPKQAVNDLISSCNAIQDTTLKRFSNQLRNAMENSP